MRAPADSDPYGGEPAVRPSCHEHQLELPDAEQLRKFESKHIPQPEEYRDEVSVERQAGE